MSQQFSPNLGCKSSPLFDGSWESYIEAVCLPILYMTASHRHQFLRKQRVPAPAASLWITDVTRNPWPGKQRDRDSSDIPTQIWQMGIFVKLYYDYPCPLPTWGTPLKFFQDSGMYFGWNLYECFFILAVGCSTEKVTFTKKELYSLNCRKIIFINKNKTAHRPFLRSPKIHSRMFEGCVGC